MTTYADERTEKQVEYDRIVFDRVQKGIELLQEKFGDDWVEHVNPKNLRLADGSACVLGQVYGCYGTGQSELEISDEEAEEAGFFATDRVYPTATEGYRLLDLAWRDAIARIKGE